MHGMLRSRLNSHYFTLIGVLILLYTSMNGKAQFYNGSQLSFGKSRVQFGDFFWTYYRFDKFDTYFYLNGKELSQFTAEYADKHIKEIELQLQSSLEEKIQFIIFNNLSDLKQSNIGLYGDWDYYNTGGVTRIIGGRVMIFFDGNYGHFEQQIRAGIATVILKQMMYGTGIGAQIKNNALFTMPEWFMNGLISYISRPWDTEIDNLVMDGVVNGRYDKFNSLSGSEATYAGHSLWYYIALRYGTSTIPNIVYMSRLSRSIERGFIYVLGVTYKTVAEEWLAFFKDLYSSQLIGRNTPDLKPLNPRKKPDRTYRQLKMNPNGNYAAFATYELGIYKVYGIDLETGKKKRIFRGGYRLAERPDLTYPLLAWHPSGKILAILTERKGESYLYLYNIEEKRSERQILYNFTKILDMSYSDDGTLLVFSAVQKGQSDIFVYNIASGSHEQLTRDIYDDENPRFINGSEEIIFSSNRRSDTLRFDPKVDIGTLRYQNDIWIIGYKNSFGRLRRITNTPDAHEMQPFQYTSNYLCFLSDANGIFNRYLARYDSTIAFIDTTIHYRYFTISYPVTNYSRNILEQDISMKGARMGEALFLDRNFKLYISDLIRPEKVAKEKTLPTYFRTVSQSIAPSHDPNIRTDTTRSVSGTVPGFRPARFSTVRREDLPSIHSRTGDTLAAGTLEQMAATLSDTSRSFTDIFMRKTVKDTLNKYRNAKQINYNVEYAIDQMVTQIDFTYLNWAYQPFTGSRTPIFINPGFNALFMVGVSDLMEDFRITGGVRLNFNLVNNEYLFSYGSFRNRLDHQIIFHRQSVEESNNYSIIRHRIHELYYIATYPFTPVFNINGTASLRYDKAVYLATDLYNLAEPNADNIWGSIKGELTYDNTRSLGLNLYHGTRYKIFGEYYRLINIPKTNMVVLGFDIRNYQKVHRTLIWANRLAASTSFGDNKLVYYMGGVDNWLFPRFNSNTPVDYSQNYAFHTLATNMRGFNQNIRNGNSFFVFNTELRMPVFRYFYNRPIRSDFLNNFQIVAFGDIGTAWTGPTPYSEDNMLFTRYIYRKPLFIKVEMLKEPIVEGFGFGARTRLLGYFIRADIAWGVEDGKVRTPIFYFSLSLDF